MIVSVHWNLFTYLINWPKLSASYFPLRIACSKTRKTDCATSFLTIQCSCPDGVQNYSFYVNLKCLLNVKYRHLLISRIILQYLAYTDISSEVCIWSWESNLWPEISVYKAFALPHELISLQIFKRVSSQLFKYLAFVPYPQRPIRSPRQTFRLN